MNAVRLLALAGAVGSLISCSDTWTAIGTPASGTTGGMGTDSSTAVGTGNGGTSAIGSTSTSTGAMSVTTSDGGISTASANGATTDAGTSVGGANTGSTTGLGTTDASSTGGATTTGAATTGATSTGATTTGATTTGGLPPLPPTDDYSDFGPFETTTEDDTGPNGTYTIVRPETLGEDGFLHAPLIFGPGIGGEVSSMMRLLERIASHGFVIIGTRLDGGPGSAENNSRMTDGLDWLIEQNTAAGSVFEGKLAVDHAVSMGYSVGGTGAVDIGGHEAIVTIVSIHGHGAEADLHGTLLLLGGTEDVMGDGQSWLAPTYEASEVQTFFSLVEGAEHGYPGSTVDGVPGGVETPAMIAWIRYWIYNDQEAKNYFYGDDCVMCSSPWTNTQRKNWE